MIMLLLIYALAVQSNPIPTVEISPGVFYPTIQLGACTDCPTKAVCCGSNLSVSLPVWIDQQRGGVAAIDTQLRYNDTAIVETEITKITGLSRDSLWITSKIDPKVFCDAPDVKATVLSMVQTSLRQLNTTHIDLMLLHEPCDQTGKPHPSDVLAWDGLQQALANHWVRSIGVDKFVPAQIDALQGSKPNVLMAEVSMSNHDESLLEYCAKHNIHVNTFGVLHGCMMSDPLVVQLSEKYNTTASQICGVWTRQRGMTMAVGVGTNPSTVLQYTKEDLDIFSFNMTALEIDHLNNLQNDTQLKLLV